MATRKNPITDPTGEKAAVTQERDRKARERVKSKMSGVVSQAQDFASSIGVELAPISNTANTVATVAATASNLAGNIKQALSPMGTGYAHSLASSSLQINSDPYGGISIPHIDVKTLIPNDLLNPTGLPSISEEQLTTGLAQYAGATRAAQLYQAGYRYIDEVGKVIQTKHKAQQSIIKGATEGIKVQQEMVRFDRQNIELGIDKEKLNHSNEKLKQAQITTTALVNETAQLALKFEAQESKRDAEIKSIHAQTQDVIQRYLTQSINSNVA